MSGRWRRRHNMCFIVFAFLFQHLGYGAAQNVQNRAANVLQRHFETVAFSQSGLLHLSSTPAENNRDQSHLLQLPFSELITALNALGPDTLKVMTDGYAEYFVGARDFGVENPLNDNGLGMVGSRKCYVGIFKGEKQPSVASVFHSASVDSISGQRAWAWSVSSGEQSRAITFYAAQIAKSYFVLTNNLEDFRAIANELLASDVSPAPVSMTFDWETLSTHKYWIYRLFRRNGVISPEAAGIQSLSRDVIAMAFYVELEKRQASLCVYSSDTLMRSIPKVFSNPDPNFPSPNLNQFEARGGGLWMETVSLSGEQSGTDALSQIFLAFGFGVAV